MEFTYIQKSIHGEKLYYPKKFFISTAVLDIRGPFKNLMLSKEKEESFRNAFAHAYSYTIAASGFEWEIWPVFCNFRRKGFRSPEFILHYNNKKINLLDFTWPGYRDDNIMKEIFLQRFSKEKHKPQIPFDIQEDILYKILMKFQKSLAFNIPFGPGQNDEEYYVEEDILDLINMKPVLLRHLKHDDSLNFTLCANDFVNLLNSSIVSVRERK